MDLPAILLLCLDTRGSGSCNNFAAHVEWMLVNKNLALISRGRLLQTQTPAIHRSMDDLLEPAADCGIQHVAMYKPELVMRVEQGISPGAKHTESD